MPLIPDNNNLKILATLQQQHLLYERFSGEVSDSASDIDKASDNNFESMEEFDDGLDENLIRDDEDRKRLEQMTEKEREQELFNRIEKREVMRTR